jgi:hypothetical protein
MGANSTPSKSWFPHPPQYIQIRTRLQPGGFIERFRCITNYLPCPNTPFEFNLGLIDYLTHPIK